MADRIFQKISGFIEQTSSLLFTEAHCDKPQVSSKNISEILALTSDFIFHVQMSSPRQPRSVAHNWPYYSLRIGATRETCR